ncbi:MAG: hypothetical protein NZ879_03440 [Archaeoglobaceae archaeon]|nr:hypothetical protein [Archaeoglobaceae archaeon]MDW8118021.1 hypothetical protein [Archaeoglobaceae archaeon]
MDEEEKIEVLSKAKALILPSSYKTPYAVLESLAIGARVVSEAVPEEVVLNGFKGFRGVAQRRNMLIVLENY